ncbi:hypothetical protein LFL96_25815 [Paraburkholderia sp. D15]|uniref:hypothetical protein n=1 Tax=Paraburkholderia sp. D15 TaxID=2880218 RepID=UPI00247A37E8|nr:hypothetical protein [Paraburkholderia sp. D15]WGS54433.1 hypothetical protein LFL96_25815 [Paraburkholderia sp. D15]
MKTRIHIKTRSRANSMDYAPEMLDPHKLSILIEQVFDAPKKHDSWFDREITLMFSHGYFNTTAHVGDKKTQGEQS